MQLAAPTYIDYVMTWVQNLLDDENIFPTKSGMCPTPHILPIYPSLTFVHSLPFHVPSSPSYSFHCIRLA